MQLDQASLFAGVGLDSGGGSCYRSKWRASFSCQVSQHSHGRQKQERWSLMLGTEVRWLNQHPSAFYRDGEWSLQMQNASIWGSRRLWGSLLKHTKLNFQGLHHSTGPRPQARVQKLDASMHDDPGGFQTLNQHPTSPPTIPGKGKLGEEHAPNRHCEEVAKGESEPTEAADNLGLRPELVTDLWTSCG